MPTVGGQLGLKFALCAKDGLLADFTSRFSKQKASTRPIVIRFFSQNLAIEAKDCTLRFAFVLRRFARLAGRIVAFVTTTTCQTWRWVARSRLPFLNVICSELIDCSRCQATLHSISDLQKHSNATESSHS
jgi:hypothetical protein